MDEYTEKSVAGTQEANAEDEIDTAAEESVETIIKPKKKAVVFIIPAAVIVVIAVVLILVLGSGKSYDRAVSKSADLYLNPSVSNARALYPEELWSYLFDTYAMFENKYENTEDLIKNGYLPDIVSEIDALKLTYGENFKLEYQITSARKMDKTSVSEISESIKSNFGNLEINVGEAYALTVSYTLSGISESGEPVSKQSEINVAAVKIGGDWYVTDSVDYSIIITNIHW